MDKLKSTKIALGVAVVLLLGAIAWGGWNVRENRGLEKSLDQEKLRVEALLSEKLLVEKDLAANEEKIGELFRKNEMLARQLEEAGNANKLKDGSIQQLQSQVGSNKKKYADLLASNTQLENRLTLLGQQIKQMQDDKLAASIEQESLRSQVDNLKRELAMAHSAYYDRALVETTRGKNDKLVVKASRAKKLKATIMIPGNLKEVQFQIFDPSGNLISASADNGTLAVQITDGDHTVASATNSSTGQTYKQAEMTFLPKKKLVKGIYRIEVLSENLTVGSLQMRLR